MLKIAVFGFYSPDQPRPAATDGLLHLSPISTEDFMRTVWEMEPEESRIGDTAEALGFVKLTALTAQPVYVQRLSDEMAHGAALLACDGYIAIIDAVKILAPCAIHNALRRLHELQPAANLIIAAGRQNEPDAFSSDEIRQMLGLSPSLPIMPYVPGEPKTVHRLIRRMVRYIDNPDHVPPPIFAGKPAFALPVLSRDDGDPASASQATSTPAPRIERLDHVAIAVSDLARALAFYQGLLGFRLLGEIDLPGEDPPRTVAHLDTGRGALALVSGAGGPGTTAVGQETRPGLLYVALRVAGLEAIVARLAQAGVAVRSVPVSTPYGVRMAEVADPDGTPIRLIEGDFAYTRR